VPRLPHPIPVRLGFSVNVGSSAASYTDTGVNYDYAIGGLAFISAATPQDPSQRKTAQFQKQQFDNSNEPGDHTLNQWWTVGQSSFHAGAGQLYIDTPDPDTDRTRRLRYQSSIGIDPWTTGQVSLLKQVSEAATSSSANCQLVTTTIAGSNYIVYADGSALKRLVEVGTTNPTYTSTTFTVSGIGTILALATDGINYWVADSTGIWKGDIASTGAGVKQYTAPAGTSLMKMAWMKQRLMVGLTASAGAFVYQLLSSPAGPPVTMTTVVGVANGAPVFQHPVATWQWTALADGPEAIYAAGYAGSSSAIYRMVLDTSGNVPLVGVGITAADFPPGELVTSMVGYLGAELGISTTAGIRVAQFQTAGTLSVGRISAPTIPGQPTSSGCVGLDRFIFAGYTHSDGVAGLMRVDPSQALAQRPVQLRARAAVRLRHRPAGGGQLGAGQDRLDEFGRGDRYQPACLRGRLGGCVRSVTEQVPSDRNVDDLEDSLRHHRPEGVPLRPAAHREPGQHRGGWWPVDGQRVLGRGNADVGGHLRGADRVRHRRLGL